jgi:hypothetical protein
MYDLHPACAAWPEMPPKELSDLADDIAANGLRDRITVTPEGLLLDGRNRALACVMRGVEIPPDKIEVYDGDPWLFSISRNARRRHMPVDAIAMVVAGMPTKPLGDQVHGGSNELPSIAQVAEAAGIPETAVKSAKAVLAGGTPEEIAEAGQKGKLRKTADKVRARTASSRKKTSDPIETVDLPRNNLIEQGETVALRGEKVDLPRNDIIEQGEKIDLREEAEIARLKKSRDNKDREIARLAAKLETANKKIAQLKDEVGRLKAELKRRSLN